MSWKIFNDYTVSLCVNVQNCARKFFLKFDFMYEVFNDDRSPNEISK